MLDLLVRAGTVVDGTGGPPRQADVGVVGDRIVFVGRTDSAQAQVVVDAFGKMVCPGFIDIHTHSDVSLLLDSSAESSLVQGVTTVVVGNCGSSAAPLDAHGARELEEDRSWAPAGTLKCTWQSFGEYLEAVAQSDPALNVASLVGHGTLRSLVVGTEAREATQEETRTMQAVLARCLEEGATGLSFGLTYPPGTFAAGDELLALAQVIGSSGDLLAVHLRNEGTRLVEATQEMLDLAEEARCRLQISHHKAMGRPNWGRVEQTLEMMDNARQNGSDVACDAYPYTAGCTSLSALVPDEFHAGGREALLARLREEETRREIERRLVDDKMRAVNGADEEEAFGQITIGSTATVYNRGLCGMSITQAARVLGLSPGQCVIHLLLKEELGVSMLSHSMCEDDVRTVLSSPLTSVASDGVAFSRQGVTSQLAAHPRFCGTYPRVFARYVRGDGSMRLEEAVRKATSAPAERLGLSERGTLVSGLCADLVVFDPAHIADTATYANPSLPPEGVDAVIVNGVIAASGGTLTGARNGRIL